MLTKLQAQELAARIQRETTDVATTIQQDDFFTSLEESYHVDVHKKNVVRLCIRSESQWDDRKHLLDKWGSHESDLVEKHDDLANS
jgi:hypothetical protein